MVRRTMSLLSETESPKTSAGAVPKAGRELNNLLQIISGTSSLLEKGVETSEGSEKYRAMLRATIERAERIAADLTQQTTQEKTRLRPEPAPFVQSTETRDSTTTKQSVQSADDEQITLTLAKRVLTEAGYQVVAAQSGVEYLDQFRRQPHAFDLILSDPTKPSMNGEETSGGGAPGVKSMAADKYNDDIVNGQGTVRLKLKISTAAKPNEVHVQPVESIDDGLLWEPCLIDGHLGARINAGHPYYQKVYLPNITEGVPIQGMDALLWGLSVAELNCVSGATKAAFGELRYEVSRNLRKLVEGMPEPA